MLQHRAVYILHGVLAEFRCESEYLKQAWGKEVTACAGWPAITTPLVSATPGISVLSQVSTASAVDTFQECLRQHKLECALLPTRSDAHSS